MEIMANRYNMVKLSSLSTSGRKNCKYSEVNLSSKIQHGFLNVTIQIVLYLSLKRAVSVMPAMQVATAMRKVVVPSVE